MLSIKSFVFSPIQENTYIVYNEKGNAIIIDPGCYFTAEEEELKSFLSDNGLTPVLLLNTHCHLDHVFGNNWVHKTYHLQPSIHANEEQLLKLAGESANRYGLSFENYKGAVHYINEGDTISLDEEVFSVLFTPGHSPGSISFYCAKQSFIISGDVLFYRSIGRTDFPLCSHEDLIQSIQTQLYTLPDETIVYSGHGQSTTIGFEKKHNPFVKG